MAKLKTVMMQWVSKMMISCEKAAFLISKKQDEKLSCPETVHLKIHTMTCKYCQWYGKEIAGINHALKNMAQNPNQNHFLQTLSEEEKNKLNTLINKNLR